MTGLNHALALIKSEQLNISYEEALKLVLEEDKKIEAKIREAVIGISKEQ